MRLPRQARPSSHVTSRLQRVRKSLRSCSAVWVRPAEKKRFRGTLARWIRKLTADQADHLPGTHPTVVCRVCARLSTHLCSGRQDRQERDGLLVHDPRKGNDSCHHDPSQARAPQRPFAPGERALAVMSPCADRAAPAPLQGFIDHQIHAGIGWDNGLDDEEKEWATHCEREPAFW